MYELMNKDLRTNSAMVPVSVEDVAGKTEKKGVIGFRSSTTTPATTTYHRVEGGLDALDKLKEEGGDEPWPFPGMKKENVVQAANVHAARLQDEMSQWFKSPEGQKATFDQANEHRMQLERPYVMESVKASLSKRAPSVVTTKEDFDALPAGAPFTWNGKIGTKN
jgi:hypothetical protein